jgi:hypothetical protein
LFFDDGSLFIDTGSVTSDNNILESNTNMLESNTVDAKEVNGFLQQIVPECLTVQLDVPFHQRAGFRLELCITIAALAIDM